MMIKMLTGNHLLIDIFGKLVYLLHVERYKCTCRARVCSPIYIFLWTVILTLWRLGQISYHYDDSRTLQYIYARWSTFSDRFHNFSFTMQSHDHNWSLALRALNQKVISPNHEMWNDLSWHKTEEQYHTSNSRTMNQFWNYYNYKSWIVILI